jgi:hypothetical protein
MEAVHNNVVTMLNCSYMYSLMHRLFMSIVYIHACVQAPADTFDVLLDCPLKNGGNLTHVTLPSDDDK